LQEISNELKGTTDLHIEIIGVNSFGVGPSSAMTDGRTLTWVRETMQYQPTKTWHVPDNTPSGLPFYRDVVILDAQNVYAGVYHLTASPIDGTDPDYLAHRSVLKAKLVAAATHVDIDGDGLSDLWEMESYGHLNADASTPAANGESALACYSSAQNPLTPNSQFAPTPGSQVFDGRRHATFTFRRRLGKAGGLRCTPEVSSTLVQWASAFDSFITESVVNPYDGTGTEIVTLRALDPMESKPNLWARLRVFIPMP
jgi:hypothetical protein